MSAPAPSTPSAPSAEALAPLPARSPLVGLVGRWKSDSGRTYEAVVSGDAVEFRILRAIELPRQGYEDAETRFRLFALPDQPDSFGVEDDLRPTPPVGLEYDPGARDSCKVVFTEIGNKRLLARYDASRRQLLVALVQLTTGADKFQTSSGRVVRCTGLSSAPAKAIESVLGRLAD